MRFIGATLWTDLALEGKADEIGAHMRASRGISDFRGPIRHRGRWFATGERREILDTLDAGHIPALGHCERLRLFEAITHFAPIGQAAEVLSFLAELVASEFAALSSNALATCRKVIARFDEALNLSSIRPRRPLQRRRFPTSD